MKIVLLLAVLMACGLTEIQGNLLQFQNMIGKLTGKNALADYGFYGCHCGLGGKGTPKDATDRCCSTHDCCYLKLVNKGCKPKTQSYNYKYQSGSITCGEITHYNEAPLGIPDVEKPHMVSGRAVLLDSLETRAAFSPQTRGFLGGRGRHPIKGFSLAGERQRYK
uniref:Phospholipase A2 n=1 Tax=Sarcophilus harrisii TaxID=9305 RepID=A0A7N4P9G2_SARHA